MQPKIEQIHYIYKHALAGIVGQFVVSSSIFYILFKQVNTNELLLWGALKLILLIARSLSLYQFHHYFKNNNDFALINQWFRYYRLLMFLSGLLWANSLYFVPQYQTPNLLFFFLATFIAMSGAAVATLGSRISIYLAFTLPMLIATVYLFLTNPEPIYFETSLLTLVGFTFLIYAAFKNSLNINQLLLKTQEINLAQKDIINRLAMAGEYKDNDTGQHVKRMSHSCYLLALKMGLSNEKAEQLFMASALHDIGKIGIPDKILLNPGKLNKDDWEIMKTHTSIGEHILCNHNSPIMELAAKIAAGHHERWNGKGYPLGISGKKIPIEMRIVSICDTFDALISKRPYKKAWPIDKALKYIEEESGQHFDPHLVVLFLAIAPEIIKYAGQHDDSELQTPLNEITTKTDYTNINLLNAKLS